MKRNVDVSIDKFKSLHKFIHILIEYFHYIVFTPSKFFAMATLMPYARCDECAGAFLWNKHLLTLSSCELKKHWDELTEKVLKEEKATEMFTIIKSNGSAQLILSAILHLDLMKLRPSGKAIRAISGTGSHSLALLESELFFLNFSFHQSWCICIFSFMS